MQRSNRAEPSNSDYMNINGLFLQAVFFNFILMNYNNYLPIEDGQTLVSPYRKISKYHNGYGKINRTFSRNIRLEEEKQRPELISIGERFLTISNEEFNRKLIRHLIKIENFLLAKKHKNETQ